MNNLDEEKLIKNDVMGEIRSSRVKMRPKQYFVFQAALFSIGGIILLLSLLYLASFIIFMLRQSGVLFMPVFGIRGWHAFLIYLPWFLLFLLFVFIVALELIVRRYPFAYKRPLLYSAAGIVIIVVLGGAIVENTPLHKELCRYTEKNSVPVVGPLCNGYYQQKFKDIHRGRIIKIMPQGFVIKSRFGESLIISENTETSFPSGAAFFEGDMVIIFGNRIDDSVRAFGIKKVND